MYMSEFCCYVMLSFWPRSPAIYPWNPKKLGTRDWPSRNWNRRSLRIAAPKSLVHVEYEKLLENYLGAQGTFKNSEPLAVVSYALSCTRPVVGCKIPWKENSLISRGIGDFFIYPARARLFRVNPASSFNQPVFFYPARLFWSIVGSTSGEPGETGRGGARKQ